MTRKPRALRPGDLIGVAAPAGPVDEERLRRGAAELERLGFAVRLGDGILERRGFTAGSVDNRVDQLHELFEDPEVAAVACARGGAGILHLLPHLDRELLRDNPKLLLGYSDVTLLHLEMERIGLASLHGPMIARELAEGDGAYDPRDPAPRADGRGRALREPARRAAGARGGRRRGRAARRLPVAPRRRRRHAVGTPRRRRADAALPRGRGREALPHRPHAAAAAGVGRAAGRHAASCSAT